MIGKKNEGLFLFLQNSAKSNIVIEKGLVGIKKKEDIWLWHKRLGHASLGAIIQILCLSQEEYKVAINNYIICHLARHIRLPFPNSTSRTSKHFHLLHINIYGALQCTNISWK